MDFEISHRVVFSFLFVRMTKIMNVKFIYFISYILSLRTNILLLPATTVKFLLLLGLRVCNPLQKRRVCFRIKVLADSCFALAYLWSTNLPECKTIWLLTVLLFLFLLFLFYHSSLRFVVVVVLLTTKVTAGKFNP